MNTGKRLNDDLDKRDGPPRRLGSYRRGTDTGHLTRVQVAPETCTSTRSPFHTTWVTGLRTRPGAERHTRTSELRTKESTSGPRYWWGPTLRLFSSHLLSFHTYGNTWPFVWCCVIYPYAIKFPLPVKLCPILNLLNLPVIRVALFSQCLVIYDVLRWISFSDFIRVSFFVSYLNTNSSLPHPSPFTLTISCSYFKVNTFCLFNISRRHVVTWISIVITYEFLNNSLI